MKNSESPEKKFSYSMALRSGRSYLEEQGIDDAQTDSWLLLSCVSGMDRTAYFLRSEETMPGEQVSSYNDLLEKRGAHIPLQYLTGTASFMGFDFVVTPAVLIPRMDTETLAEEALKFLRTCRSSEENADVRRNPRVLDLCTGSGCLAVSVKRLDPGTEVFASDISPDALAVAERNAERLSAGIKFIQSDLFEKTESDFDLIVSNPPYIREKVIAELAPEVRDHEPHLALSGGADGLDFYRRICREAPAHLRPGGALMMEIGYDQAEDVSRLMNENEFKDVRRIRDLSGHDRVVTGIRKNV